LESCCHPAGDRVLQTLAEVLRTHTRAGDLLCRFGGEEFLVVLPNASAAQARQRAETWRTAFAASVTEFDGHEMWATISAGIAAYRPCREGEPVGLRPGTTWKPTKTPWPKPYSVPPTARSTPPRKAGGTGWRCSRRDNLACPEASLA
jgi:hypothetical protein